MSLNPEVVNAIGLAVVAMHKKKNKKKRSKGSRRRLMKRERFSDISLLKELKSEPQDWCHYIMMDELTYLEMLHMITPAIQRQDTNMRTAITPMSDCQ